MTNRLVFRLSNVGIGVSSKRLTLAGGGGGQREVKLEAPDLPCTELHVDNISIAGTLVVQTKELNKLVLGNVFEDKAAEVGALEIEATRLRELLIGNASMNQLSVTISPAPLDNSGVEVRKFGSLRISRSAFLPTPMVDSVINDLQASGLRPYPEKVAIRQFLRDLRAVGQFSDTRKPMAKYALYQILTLDAETYYGPAITWVIVWLTGFGIWLSYPLTAFLVVSTICFLCVSAIWFRSSTLVPFRVRFYPLRYVGMILGLDKAIEQISPAAHAVIYLHRFILVFQITLVGLFIQNAVLAGL